MDKKTKQQVAKVLLRAATSLVEGRQSHDLRAVLSPAAMKAAKALHLDLPRSVPVDMAAQFLRTLYQAQNAAMKSFYTRADPASLERSETLLVIIEDLEPQVEGAGFSLAKLSRGH